MQGASRVQVYMLFFAVVLAACVLFLGMQGAKGQSRGYFGGDAR